MIVRELTDVIVNMELIVIFNYDTEELYYQGPNLEAAPATQTDKKVLYVKSYKNIIQIGVKD